MIQAIKCVLQGAAPGNQRMAIPYPMLPTPMYQRQPALVPSDLLAAIEGWDPRSAWNPIDMSRGNMAGLSPGPLGPIAPNNISPLEGAGRMSQEGGVIGGGSFAMPSTAGRAPPLHECLSKIASLSSIPMKIDRPARLQPFKTRLVANQCLSRVSV